MTAREKIAGYESRLREYTNFAVRGVKKVCKECGPRPSCSPQEKKAQDMMRKDLETCCDSVRAEPFKAAPGAFLFWVRPAVVIGFVSALAYNLGYALVGVALIALEMLAMVLEFILYKRAIDVFLPKSQAQNLVGVRKPAGEVKRRLILSGHTDSANEWKYTYLGYKHFKKPVLLVPVVALALVTLLFCLGVYIAAAAAGKGWVGFAGLESYGPALRILGYVCAGLCLLIIPAWFFEDKKRPVMGASDNLSGCFTAMAVAKLLGDLNLRLENTELVVLCAGCEEIGLRGAKAFGKAHAKEYEDAETAFIALDTMTDFEFIKVMCRDLNGTVKHDSAVCAMVKAGAKNAGHDIPYGSVFFGSSDATAATQAGFRACLLSAMDEAPADYYHTRLDTVDRLRPKTVEACLDILMETVYLFDETGLAPFEGAKVKAGE
ncbi:MAG: M28 family metallopeptidase [Firmicutes bacterium]|nr:M28 family metallopeptidase [Bacillota bacterium]